MSLLLKESERNQQEWNRKTRDAVNGVIRRLLGVGATGDRPASPTDGQMFYDDTLKRPVWYNSADAVWRGAEGAGIPSTVTIALAAGAANTMTITMTVKDAGGVTIAAVFMLEWWISEATTGIGLTADTYSGDVTTTTGTEYQEIVTKKHFTGLTNASGVLVASAVASAKPADQYIAVKNPATGKVIVSAASGTNWGA